ncbi:hypothetical protein BV898_07636 [Hypsibius exemplaris]|uniref:Uncharacterized protein n=1 Tax=Hypsibius exemplaris TaxID=2072580 RepID=A0A1W0WSS8_HYPEX|nr:hypothetical protein BV898_07636 [Hypsibius exemplaris]
MDFNHTAHFPHVDSDEGDSSLSEKLRGISSRNSFDSDYCRFKDPVPLGETLFLESSGGSDLEEFPMSINGVTIGHAPVAAPPSKESRG